eukprot:CAMPEP_0115110588 /NCGR_PEP_ID=MMETSP0227-20121206/39484_1 /TAXON_ID=89957 /ORGANISM="Polarella glacialis, Strain CCMP 1383" /LENGTH=136 /DNA_ID=CAMNT_0002509693 /DNA_START=1114 /DNA_END=1524 /DNA_ORIENTATION=-
MLHGQSGAQGRQAFLTPLALAQSHQSHVSERNSFCELRPLVFRVVNLWHDCQQRQAFVQECNKASAQSIGGEPSDTTALHSAPRRVVAQLLPIGAVIQCSDLCILEIGGPKCRRCAKYPLGDWDQLSFSETGPERF